MDERCITHNGNILYRPHPKQIEFHDCPAKYTCIAGGIGSAKSTALVMEDYQLCLDYPGIYGFMGRKYFADFKISTRKVWEKMIPRELYRDNQQKQEFTVITGQKLNSTILYGGFDRTESKSKFLSTEFGFVSVDQAEELTPKEYADCSTRLRQTWKVDGKDFRPRYRGLFSANPRKCILRDIYVENPDADHVLITSNAEDNPSLPPGYIEDAKHTMEISHLPPAVINAMIYGSWDLELSECGIIAWSKVVAAAKVIHSRTFNDKCLVVCDPAREGDDLTQIYGYQGSRIVAEETYGKKDLDFTAARMVKMQKEISANTLLWDADGIGGGLKSHLKYLAPEKTCLMEFKGSLKLDNQYYNQRAEAHFEAGELFGADNMSIPDDAELKGQLIQAHFEYRQGKLIVEEKAEIKKRLGRSPDKADACIMGVWGLKRCPSMGIIKPVRRGTMGSVWIEQEEAEYEKSRDDEIGNAISKHW